MSNLIERMHEASNSQMFRPIESGVAPGRAADGAADKRPEILCAMRMPPNSNGHGGSQRAWHLLQALLLYGRVHFVLLYRQQDKDCVTTSLEPIERMCESVTRIDISGWQGHERSKWSFLPPKVMDLLTMRSHEAPHLSDSELAVICKRLPVHQPDVLFAGRLCCSWILQSLIERGCLASPYRVVDFDDVMSKFRLRQLATGGPTMKNGRGLLTRIDAWIIRHAERKIARDWHGVSVCTDEDVSNLRATRPAATVAKIANVVDRELLAPRTPDGQFRLLFAGNLGFSANIDGLSTFVEGAWPQLLLKVPSAKLSIVGLNPSGVVIDIAKKHGFDLHADVPTLQPFYANCDVVIAPILFGSGTRIKVLEAMAFGRPIVSTSMGAEGLHLKSGVHLILADSMHDFASALIDLASNPDKGQRLAAQARRFQEENYAPAAFRSAVAGWLTDSRANADRRVGTEA